MAHKPDCRGLRCWRGWFVSGLLFVDADTAQPLFRVNQFQLLRPSIGWTIHAWIASHLKQNTDRISPRSCRFSSSFSLAPSLAFSQDVSHPSSLASYQDSSLSSSISSVSRGLTGPIVVISGIGSEGFCRSYFCMGPSALVVSASGWVGPSFAMISLGRFPFPHPSWFRFAGLILPFAHFAPRPCPLTATFLFLGLT